MFTKSAFKDSRQNGRSCRSIHNPLNSNNNTGNSYYKTMKLTALAQYQSDDSIVQQQSHFLSLLLHAALQLRRLLRA